MNNQPDTPPNPLLEADIEYANLDQSTAAAGRTLARWFKFHDRLTAESEEAIETLDMAKFESALRSLARLGRGLNSILLGPE